MITQSLYNQFHNTAIKYPKNEALRFENLLLNYKELDKKILECKNIIASLGIKKGDVISVSLPNCPLSIYLFYAINALGAISYNIHPLTKAPLINKMMENTNSKILFSLSLNRKDLEENLNKDIKIILINPYYKVNFVKYLAVKKMSGKANTAIPYKNLKKLKTSDFYHPIGKEDSVYLNTGGTNGDPKVVRLSNDSINYLASQGYQLIQGPKENIKMLTAIPLFHGFGLGMGVHTPLSHGASTVLMLKFNTKEAIHHIQKGYATVILGVPALFNALLSKDSFYGPFLKKQVISYIGGDNVPKSLIERWNKAMQDNGSEARLYEGYGLTETVTCCTVNTRYNRSKDGSIGKPLPGIEIKIRNPETKEILKPNTPGEIIISGPTLMNGYLNCEKETNDVLFTLDNKVYLSTKDYGYLDEDGYLFFKQRMRRIVKVNGESLCPSDVENIVMKNSNIYELYCYGVKDEKRGHCFRLAVSKKDDSTITDAELEKQIRDSISSTLPPSYMPDKIIFYKRLPHTPVGKIDTTKFEEN